MGAVVGIVAGLIALLGLIVALGNAGYLAMLNSAARKRGLSGESAALYVKERRGVAIGTTAVAALGLLLTLGGRVQHGEIAGVAQRDEQPQQGDQPRDDPDNRSHAHQTATSRGGPA